MNGRNRRILGDSGFAVAGLILLFVAGALAVEPVLRERHVAGFVERFDAFRAVAAVAFGVPGAFVVTRRPELRVGWLLLAVGFAQGVSLAAGAYGLVGINDRALPFDDELMWVSNWLWVPPYLAVPTVFPLFLPDGRLPSRRWWPVAALAVAAMAAGAAGWALMPAGDVDVAGLFPPGYTGLTPPFQELAPELMTAGQVLGLAAAVAAIGSLVWRYRRASGEVRRQVQWVLAGGLLTLAVVAAAAPPVLDSPELIILAPVPLPVALAVAVLRHRLWDIDLLLARTLTVAALVVTLVVVYAACALLLGGLSPPALAAAAALAYPAYTGIHRRANQVVFGERDDPVAALRRLGDRLAGAGHPSELLEQVTESLGRALRVRYVAVEEDGVVVAAWGEPGGPLERVPLRHRGAETGTLVVGEPLRRRDRTVLTELAPHIAVTVRAHRLAADLERSHRRLLAAREEERARLMHELHDGVGPTLAALAFQADRARRQAPEAAELLAGLATQIRATVVNVRAIVNDLRPPPLDDLGLTGALEELAGNFAGGLSVTVRTGGALPVMPAPVELAAYRIAAEAMNNAARHSGASCCAIDLDVCEGGLRIRIDDDGSGLPEPVRPGVGLSSMRRRAADLGGTFDLVAPPGGGLSVRVVLPLEEPVEEP
ncbi:sensor histidine kinase [Herbidospora daliensis]|uniref:sensor histidine kinase n=1 Tax=Herbidospora daliensis TaxID=295585 RepID=UPI00078611C7|nr:sensor histidine kinase [Herbidospora daliensis]